MNTIFWPIQNTWLKSILILRIQDKSCLFKVCIKLNYCNLCGDNIEKWTDIKGVSDGYLSLSSAALEASSNFSVAVWSRSSDLSMSSSRSWILRFKLWISCSAYNS